MIIISFLIFLLNNAWADGPLLKELKLTNPISQELNLLIEDLRQRDLNYQQAKRVISYVKGINFDTKKMDEINLLFIIKSEIYKGLLSNQHLPQDDKLQVSEVILKSIEEKFKKYDLTYSEMSKWVFQSILKDLQSYREDNFIDRYQAIDPNDSKEKLRVLELKRKLKYLSSWIIAFESLSPERINQLLSETAIDILHSISIKTYFFREYSSQFSQGEVEDLFVIPEIKKKIEPTEMTPVDLNDLKEKETQEAKESIEKLKNDNKLENPSPLIDAVIKKEEEENQDQNDATQEESKTTDQWTPKD